MRSKLFLVAIATVLSYTPCLAQKMSIVTNKLEIKDSLKIAGKWYKTFDGSNFANSDLTATGTRYHNWKGLYDLTIDSMRSFLLYVRSQAGAGKSYVNLYDTTGQLIASAPGATSYINFTPSGINLLSGGKMYFQDDSSAFAQAGYIWTLADPSTGLMRLRPAATTGGGGGGNFANTDLNASGNRIHNFKNFSLKIDSLNYYAIGANSTDAFYTTGYPIKDWFVPTKAAFKGGYDVNPANWSIDSISHWSYSWGYNNFINPANGYWSMALGGIRDTIWGQHSFAIGDNNKLGSKTNNSQVLYGIGYGNILPGTGSGYAFAYGYANNNAGQNSLTLGFNNNISSSIVNGIAVGSLNVISGNGNGGFAAGYQDTVTGIDGTALGNQSRASSTVSTAIGLGVISNGIQEFATGRFNDTTLGKAFVVGWGTNNNTRQNIFSVDTLGNASVNKVNKITITPPASSATLSIADGSTFATSGSYNTTLTATATTATTLPPVSGTLPVTVASGTVSNASTLDIDMSAYYNSFNIIKIYLYNLRPVSNGADIWLQLSADGSTYDNGSSNYSYIDGWHNNTTSGSTSIGGDSKIVMFTGINNGSSDAIVGEITLFSPGLATLNPNIRFDMYYNQLVQVNGGGTRLNSQVTKGIRLLMSLGNITGSYSVVGYK